MLARTILCVGIGFSTEALALAVAIQREAQSAS